MQNPEPLAVRTRPVWVWLLRIAVGLTFVVSGLAKSIDIWGTVYKFDEYFNVWGIPQPRMLVLAGAIMLCGSEFLAGLMLLLGCYRRVSVWIVGLMMAGLLPLSLWIWLADPVADCGCFGDFLHISNAATFWKNVALTAGIALLWRSNSKVDGLISPYLQWFGLAIGMVYVLIVALIGYTVQPLIDFRRFPVDTHLVSTDENVEAEDNIPDVSYTFIYTKDGQTREFTEDALPDSTWTFVDRRVTGGSEEVTDRFAILEDGEDVTADLISPEGSQIVVVVPEIMRVNPSHTYAINTLDRYIRRHDGNLTVLLAPDRRGIDYWMDISMATYPVATAEPTLLKELVRGNIGIVYLNNGRILWKRTLSSMDTGRLETPDTYNLASDVPAGPDFFRNLSLAAAGLLLILILLDRTGVIIHGVWHRRKKSKS